MSEHPSPYALPQLRMCYRQLILLTVSLSMGFSIVGNAQTFTGQTLHSYSLEWNGSAYQVSGYPGQSFPPLSLYENHYYVLENNSTIGTLLSVGENNQSSYGKPDVWNNGAHGNEEYLLIAPDVNSSRTLHYFNPDQNGSTGQLNVLPYDSHLLHPDLSLDDSRFGHAVQINDWNQTIVGAPGQGTLDGAVYLFNRESNGSQTQLQMMMPSVVDGQFGASVEANGDFLGVGAPDESGFQGKAYLYMRESNGSYALWETHAPPSPQAGDSFGWAMAMDTSSMVVASLQRQNGGSGQVSHYSKNPDNTWSFVSSFSSDDNQSGDEFGHDLDLSGNYLIVGAPMADADGNNSGSAYIFELNGSSWSQVSKLQPTGLSIDDKFGYSVALSGNLAFVGAVNGDSNVSNTGCVYVFEKTQSGWTEISKINPPSLTADQLFASNLEVNDDLLMVGAPQQGEDGFGYIYRADANASFWTLISALDCKAAASSSKNLTFLALKDGMAVIGSPGDSTQQSFGGGVLVFYNDAWNSLALPQLHPVIDGNSTPLVHFTEVEVSNHSYTYDFNGSHPFSNSLTWTIDDANFSSGQSSPTIDSTTGVFTYRPDANFSGLHSFTISLHEGNLSDSVQFSVFVDGTPDSPVFSNPGEFILPNAMEGDDYNQSISLFDADGDALSLTLSGGAPPANFAIVGTNLTFAPPIGAAGGLPSQAYTFQLTVSDGSLSSVQTFQLTVLARNEPPYIWVDGNSSVTDLNVTIPEDSNATTWFSVLPTLDYNDSDGHTIELNASVSPAHGTLTLDINAVGNQSVLYLPDADFNGTDTFTIRLNDVVGTMNKYDELTFYVTVTPVNDPPVITSVPPSQFAPEGVLFAYELNVSDPDQGDSFTVVYSNLPTWLSFNPGSLTVSGTPSWQDYEESGPRLILIEVTDQAGAKGSQGFLLEVVPTNYPPSIVQGSSITIQVNEDSDFTDISVSATDQDETVGQLSWVLGTAPANGTANVSGNGTVPSVLQYKPDANFTGADSFVINVFDSGDPNAQDSITIQVAVLPLDDAPAFTSATKGIAVRGHQFEYNATVFDADGQESLVISVLSPLPDWVTFVDDGNGSARFYGTPSEYDVGQNLIVLEGRDSTNLFAQQTFFLKVIGENTNPTITQGDSVSFSAVEDTTWVGDGLLTASDADGQDLQWSLSGQPSHGSVIAEGLGGTIQRLEYIPDGNYSGLDAFVVSVSDGVGSSSVTVTLNVQNVDDAPVFSVFPSNSSIVDGNLLSLPIVVYDADGLGGATLSETSPLWLLVDSSNLTITGSIPFQGTPAVADEGNHSVSLTVTDSTGLSVSASLIVTVEVHNYPPSINAASFSVQMTEDLGGTWSAPSLSATDLETNASLMTWGIAQAPGRGTAAFVTANDPSSLTYLPDGNFSGMDSFVISVTDGGGIHSSAPKTATAIVSVEVLPVNDAPVFTSIPATDLNDGTYSWNDESEYVYKVISYDSDWDWQTLELNVTSVLPNWLTFVSEGNGTGTLRGTGAVKDKGTYQIQFTATDSYGTTAEQNFSLVLRIDNYPPVFKSSSTGSEITELIVYLDEDSKAGDARGWLTPVDYFGEDPDPQLQNPLRDLKWTLGSSPLSLAQVEVNGTGLRPQGFSYEIAKDFSGNDLFHLKAFDGHRSALLPVRIVVRPVPDSPVFTKVPQPIIYGKVGALLQIPLETSDPDGDSRKIEVVGLPQGDEGFWFGITDLNETRGSAILQGVPPNGLQGKRYPIALIATDSTGRYATASALLIIDGANRTPIIQGGETVQFAFDGSGNVKGVDLASIVATDFDGDSLLWSLSPLSEHKYGVPKVSGVGARPTTLTYLSYGSNTADSFVIRVSDGLSFDELKIVPLIVSSHESIQVDMTEGNVMAYAGVEYSSYFSLSPLSDSTIIDASLDIAPSWLKVSKVSRDLFRLHGMVPKSTQGNFDVRIVFSEGGVGKATKSVTLSVSSLSSPTVALKGERFLRLKKGASFVDPGYTATGAGGQDLSSSVITQGLVDPNALGLFELVYNVTDPIGGGGVSVKRFVQVVEGNASVVVKTLHPLTPGEALGVLPSSENTLIWGKGKNGTQISGPTNSVSFVSSINEMGHSIRAEFFESLSGQDVSIDDCITTADGNFLLVGRYKGNLLFREYQFLAKGEQNLFIVKLDPDFNLLWSKTLYGTSEIGSLRLSQLKDGSLLLGGGFAGSLTTEIGTYVSVAKKDLFLSRLDQGTGGFIWMKRFGGAGDDSVTALEAKDDLIYLAGNVIKTGFEQYSFLFEMDGDGSIQSSLALKGLFQNNVKDLAVGGEKIYLLGSFASQLKLSNESLTSMNNSSFVLALKKGLTEDWAVAFSDQSEPVGIETDAFGYPVILNRFSGSFAMDEASLNLSSQGSGDLVVTKLGKDGGDLVWHKQVGGAGDENSTAFKTDRHGRIFTLISTDQTFLLDGLSTNGANLLLATIESRDKPSFPNPLSLSLSKGNGFHTEINATIPNGFASMELLNAPSWVFLKDDGNGTGLIGGVVSTDANESSEFKVRVIDPDGAYADLNVSCSISDLNQSEARTDQFPSFSSSLDLGANVIVSEVFPSSGMKYVISGKFKGSLQVGSLKAEANSGYDGFAMQVNSTGTAESLLHMVSDGDLDLAGTVTDEDGNIHLIGSFSGKLSVGFLDIVSSGGRDLFILSWSKDGDLLNLQGIGGAGNEIATSATCSGQSLILGGYFNDSFDYGTSQQASGGGSDGFIMSISVFSFSQVNWFMPLVSTSDAFVRDVDVGSDGSVFFVGSFAGNASLGGIQVVSQGLSDGIVGKLASDGQVNYLKSGGGKGKDEVGFVTAASGSNLIVGGTFAEKLEWDSQRVTTKGGKDTFLATFSASGNCLSLVHLGGNGSEDIKDLMGTGNNIVVLGTFNGTVQVGTNTFDSKGEVDSYLAFYDPSLKTCHQSVHFGGTRNDLLNAASSAVEGHFVLAGLSDRRLGQNLESSLVDPSASSASFLSFYGPVDFSPRVWPAPPPSVGESSFFEYRFNSGPWPSGASLAFSVQSLPSWANASLDQDGSGVIWGMAPASSAGHQNAFSVDCLIKSERYGEKSISFTTSIVPNAEIFKLVSDSTSDSVTQFQKYSFIVNVLGDNPGDVLVFPETLPSWMTGTRLDDTRFLLEGTPVSGNSGTSPVKLRASNASYEESFEVDVKVQSTLQNSSVGTEYGNWKESWFGLSISFDNSWSYHSALGWIYVESSKEGDAIWFWNEKWGWLWTDQGHWDSSKGEGFLYSYQTGNWLYFKKGIGGGANLVFLYETSKWDYYESQ
ncbi:Ig-like domain-containing protein [Verrucomicrobia bacterium]|nr:Ig-like domain-containing protein [Verrucomicrobiota bacterium]